MKPIIAIVGRPNVGKSTLFNNLIGDKIAIVDDLPGVTRDRLYRDTEWSGSEFVIVDTGGLEPRNNDFLMTKIKEQAEVAMNEADVILFVVDGKAGLNPLDDEIAYILRKKNKPVILCVNKIDNYFEQQDDIYDFYGLGFEYLVPISGEHKVNLGDMLDIVVEIIGRMDFPEEDEDVLKLAVIGKPNAGKSSLVNKLSGSERTIVSDIAGTTRDAIDTLIEYKDNKYMIIDTAGIRRKSKVEESLEYYSVLRALKSIKRADVCILMLDAKEGLTEQDKRIAGIAAEELKPIIIVMNKWDLVENKNNVTYFAETAAQKDYDINIAGWGPDFQDPSTYLNIFDPDKGDMLQNIGLEKGQNADLADKLGLNEFKKLNEDADSEKQDTTARYTKYAAAQAWLTDSSLVIPIQSNGGSPLVMKAVPFTKPYSLVGIKGDVYVFKYREVQNDIVTAKDYKAAEKKWKKEKEKSNAKAQEELADHVK